MATSIALTERARVVGHAIAHRAVVRHLDQAARSGLGPPARRDEHPGDADRGPVGRRRVDLERVPTGVQPPGVHRLPLRHRATVDLQVGRAGRRDHRERHRAFEQDPVAQLGRRAAVHGDDHGHTVAHRCARAGDDEVAVDDPTRAVGRVQLCLDLVRARRQGLRRHRHRRPRPVERDEGRDAGGAERHVVEEPVDGDGVARLGDHEVLRALERLTDQRRRSTARRVARDLHVGFQRIGDQARRVDLVDRCAVGGDGDRPVRAECGVRRRSEHRHQRHGHDDRSDRSGDPHPVPDARGATIPRSGLRLLIVYS